MRPWCLDIVRSPIMDNQDQIGAHAAVLLCHVTCAVSAAFSQLAIMQGRFWSFDAVSSFPTSMEAQSQS
jgi:hypothetical protein